MKSNKNKYDVTKSRNMNNSFPVKEYEKLVKKYMDEDKLREAIEYLDKLINNKESFMYYMELGLCYFDLYEYEKALPPFTKCYNYLMTPAFYNTKDSESVIYNTLTDMMDCHFHLKEYDKVIEFCKKTEPNHKSYKASLESLVIAYLYLNDIENMKLYLQLLFRKDPKNTEIKCKLSQCYIEKEDVENAMKYFDELKKEDFSVIELYNLIIALSNHTYYEKRIKYCELYFEIIDLKKTVSTDLTYGEILDEIIYCYYMQKNYEKTIEFFEKLKIHHDLYNKEINYQYLDYLLPFATISYLKLKKYNEITVILIDLFKQNYGYYELYILFAIVLYFKKNFEVAIEYCKKITSNDNFLVDLIVIIIKNSKNIDLKQMKKDFIYYIQTNKNENPFILIAYYCLYYIFKNENNKIECEKYKSLIKPFENKEEYQEIFKKLVETEFDEQFYNNILLLCLDIFNFFYDTKIKLTN